MSGWNELLSTLPSLLLGFPEPSEWLGEIMEPPFETSFMCIWRADHRKSIDSDRSSLSGAASALDEASLAGLCRRTRFRYEPGRSARCRREGTGTCGRERRRDVAAGALLPASAESGGGDGTSGDGRDGDLWRCRHLHRTVQSSRLLPTRHHRWYRSAGISTGSIARAWSTFLMLPAGACSRCRCSLCRVLSHGIPGRFLLAHMSYGFFRVSRSIPARLSCRGRGYTYISQMFANVSARSYVERKITTPMPLIP